MTEPVSTAAAAAPGRAPRRMPRRNHPVLEQLASLYPKLFGDPPAPLKRGVFQDLQAAHPGLFEPEALKAALGIHTRSTRYLQAVAGGQKRRDLQGQPVESVASEHVHHALLELWRRREPRTPESERPALRVQTRERIVRAYLASGLDRAAYDALVRTRDEAAGALLDEALAEAAAREARAEALLRAFEASDGPLETFAEMYGLDPRLARQMLDLARRRRDAATPKEAVAG